MAFKNLSNDEMLAVSKAWIDPANPASDGLAAVPRLGALVPEITEAHNRLREVLGPQEDNTERSATIERAAELDRHHDALVNAIYGYLGAAAQLGAPGDSLLELRDQLMPEGLGPIVQATYRGQAGFAARLQEALTGAQRAQLAALPLPGGTLLDKVEAWLDTAAQLGALEEERARSEAQAAGIDGPQLIAARNGWVRMANAVVAVAHLTELAPEVEGLLFGPLRDAEATADARSSRRSAATQRRTNAGVSDVAPAPGAAAGQSTDDSEAQAG